MKLEEWRINNSARSRERPFSSADRASERREGGARPPAHRPSTSVPTFPLCLPSLSFDCHRRRMRVGGRRRRGRAPESPDRGGTSADGEPNHLNLTHGPIPEVRHALSEGGSGGVSALQSSDGKAAQISKLIHFPLLSLLLPRSALLSRPHKRGSKWGRLELPRLDIPFEILMHFPN